MSPPETSKYADECEMLLYALEAAGVALIVFGGKYGSGFAYAARDPTLHRRLPAVLRSMADAMEKDPGRPVAKAVRKG
jgi:hypothetical protein